MNILMILHTHDITVVIYAHAMIEIKVVTFNDDSHVKVHVDEDLIKSPLVMPCNVEITNKMFWHVLKFLSQVDLIRLLQMH